MGGCRCTYRNCTMKSDGTTHMFHYPVFEKARCQQWLVNANRLEFLNLKVSQLKNRVVCQHHFTDDSFMNYKKNKLTFDAIPTEDGPFCDSSKWTSSVDASKLYSFIIEDIENDYVQSCDKKANFAVKYVDFLTNCEMIDYDEPPKSINVQSEFDNIFVEPLNVPKTISLSKYKSPSPVKINSIQNQVPTTCTVAQYNNKINGDKLLCKIENNIQVPQSCTINTTIRNNEEKSNVLKEKKVTKVKIISEKKMSEPITIKGLFKTISPSININPREKLKLNNQIEKPETNLLISSNYVMKPNVSVENNYVIQEEIDPLQQESCVPETVESKPVELYTVHRTPSKTKLSLVKNKTPPERRAAIQNKREFNMKLRNIIEASLEKKVDLNSTAKKTSLINNNLNKPQDSKKQAVSCLIPVPAVTKSQDYTMAFLEERLNKMENILLKRIDQNSQQISELKANAHAQLKGKKDTCSQTNENEHGYKRFLYQEISKFLTPTTNSAIYEELFINKFAPNESGLPQKYKRRKFS